LYLVKCLILFSVLIVDVPSLFDTCPFSLSFSMLSVACSIDFVKRYVTVKSFKSEKGKLFGEKYTFLILYKFLLHTYVSAFIGFNDTVR